MKEDDSKFRLADDKELTPELLAKFITLAKTENATNYRPLLNAYLGDQEIIHQENKPAFKPDNRLISNFAKYMMDTFEGFFMGIPVKTICDEPEVNEAVEFVQIYNDQDDNNAELSKMMSIYGHAYEMYYVTEEKEIGITYLSPMDAFMIYDESIVERPRYFVRWYVNDDNEEVGSVSDETTITYFHNDGGGYVFDEQAAHGFAGVPATEYLQNAERIGLFQPVMTLMNAYNKGVSEKANDVDYFADAYLLITGDELSAEDLKDIRAQRVINIPGSGDSQIRVEFLDKPSSDETQEHYLERLERLIYLISMIPNINDESFGTSSGIAMQYKLLNMRNLSKTKQRKFTSGMNRRWKLIFSNPLMAGRIEEDDWMKLRYSFSMNTPANTLEEAQTAGQLSGIVSRQTQLECLSIVENVQDEMKRIEQEEAEMPLLDFDGHVHDDAREDVE